MNTTFHPGELAVQERAGTREMAARVGQIIDTALSPRLADFLAESPLLVLGAADDDGGVWASPWFGAPGFVTAARPDRVRVRARPDPNDPLAAPLARGIAVGMLAIDPAMRRRVRVNGHARQAGDGLEVDVTQAFVNCPKYIQHRLPAGGPRTDAAGPVRIGAGLDARQRAWIAGADTAFVATLRGGAAPPAGVDASHRGGPPGFVRVEPDGGLLLPDYAGNGMFNTLGNLLLDPRIGITFVAFDAGRVLQLTGRGEIDWSAEARARLPGAERVVRIAPGRVVERPLSLIPWTLVEPSPFNPG